MSSLRERLQRIPWQDLQHAYGGAKDTPAWLLALLSEHAEEREHALSELWGSICHQGSVYEASCAAVPFLIEILEQVPDQRKVEILELLNGLAYVSWYSEKERRFLKISRNLGTGNVQRWQSWGEFLEQGNEFHESHWMKQGHRLVGEGVNTYLTLLHSNDLAVIRETLHLVAGFKEQNILLIPSIVPLAFEPQKPSIQVAALESLAPLLEKESSHWAQYYLLASGNFSRISLAAAYGLAWYYPEKASQITVKPLVENMLKSHYGRKRACDALAHLGDPLGLQCLIEALERGGPRWSVLDTMRIAEALLDVAFFGGWVQGRYWQRRVKPSSQPEISTILGIQNSSQDEDLPDMRANESCFGWDYSRAYVSPDPFLVQCFGCDDNEKARLKQLFDHKGASALTASQRRAIEAVLRCESLWQVSHNLFEIYGLPVARDEIEAFLKSR